MIASVTNAPSDAPASGEPAERHIPFTVLVDPSSRSGAGQALNFLGAIVVGAWLLSGNVVDGRLAPSVLALSIVTLVAWLVRVAVPLRWQVVRTISVVVMVLGGAFVTADTNGLMITPVLIGLGALASDTERRLTAAVVLVLMAAAIVSVSAIITKEPPAVVIGVLGGFALAFVVGLSRRQNRLAVLRERELIAQQAEIEREQHRSALLADRARIARDIHDVLAHSLGGLVIQLDAVDALLENGRVDEAAQRVTAARRLAADGLGEARRAVGMLRDPGPDPDANTGSAEAVSSDSLAAPDAIAQLLVAHESLGGRVQIEGDVLDLLDVPHRRALAAIVRESLSNARRHAPGEPVTILFSHDPARGVVRAAISNAIAGPVSHQGGGHGVTGMRERFTELGDASALAAGVHGGRFVVDATVVTR
jgi:signal transduction histidine kinase